jgi:hypothetical protein
VWWGGFSVGPRHFVSALPFFLPPIAAAWQHLVYNSGRTGALTRPRLAGALIIGLPLVASLVLVIGESWARQGFPKDDPGVNWWTHTIPAWRSGDVARNIGMLAGLHGAGSLLPLALLLAILWTVVLLLLRLRQPSRRTTAAL